MQPGLQPRDHAAVFGGQHEARLSRRLPRSCGAARLMEAMDLLTLDVDEPHGFFRRVPERPFTELRADGPDTFGLHFRQIDSAD